ncbi:hypothetical protein O181_056392 [Austropuccinia psidii MF-1]|uniref:Uncharacterized protein n=1 Tax=Austropuccinia psidii MF-1 TaxID=1389203 RepID=A0A9Q3EFM0_9BASI|nr:hypothetical protein [Austropuccinia psidii MF-1]
MHRRALHPESLESRKEILKHMNEPPDMEDIRNIGHNEVVAVTTSVLITWNDCKSRLCGDFRELSNYTKADSYPIPMMSHVLDKLAKARYINKMECMRGFHKNEVRPNSMKKMELYPI